MDTLQTMRAFVQVVESGSFTAAAERMNTTTVIMSRSVSDLETHLRTRLLHRTSRRIGLTEAGERYLDRCKRILTEVDEAEAEASNTRATPSGTLRVHATPSLGQYFVAPAAAMYRIKYPTVSIELTLGQDAPDLIESRYDVAVQMTLGNLPDSGLVATRLGNSYSVLCAAPAYLEKHGVPQTLSDLANHICSQVSAPFFPPDRWHFDGPTGKHDFDLPAAFFRVNNAEALAAALREGAGVGPLPAASAVLALSTRELVRVLPEYRLQSVTLHVLYVSRRYLDAKINTWVEFLREAVPIKLSQVEAALDALDR